MEEKFTETLYPRLEKNIEPTAPPIEENEYVDLDTKITHENRLQHIKDIKSNLEQNSEQRRSLSKKYKKAFNILHYTNYGLNFLSASAGIAGVTTLSTVFLIPVSLSLSGVSAVCGGLSILTSKINKKLKLKEEKHREIYMTAEIYKGNVEELLSKAMNNGNIDHNEFALILEENKKFQCHKENIRTSKNKIIYVEKDDLKDKLKKLIN